MVELSKEVYKIVNRKDFETLTDAIKDLLETTHFEESQRKAMIDTIIREVKANNANFTESKFRARLQKINPK